MEQQQTIRVHESLAALIRAWATRSEIEQLKSEGPTDKVDVRPLIVKKVLEDPRLGRELLATWIANDTDPDEAMEFLARIFQWIDQHAVTVEDADAMIMRFCRACGLEWERVPGGFRVRPTIGGPSRSVVQH